MPIGPGKYDAVCTEVRTETAAKGVIVIVIDGALGTGFSIQAPMDVLLKLPDMLEMMAREIRASLEQGRL